MRTSEQPSRNDVVEILIADDHELFRRTLRGFIEAQPGWHVCGEAGDGLEALDKAKLLRPDVVLMDINMPRMDGLEATRVIRRELPELQGCHRHPESRVDRTSAGSICGRERGGNQA